MDLKIWFKGLGVFVLSSFVTALATMSLDPASFNFSKAGLVKVGMAALVIGIKAVLLYLKQSPLPGQAGGNYQLDQGERCAGILPGVARLRIAWLREFMGPEHIRVSGGQQVSD